MSRVQSSSSASTVGIKDTAGNSLTSTDGALDVNIVSSPTTSGTAISNYNGVPSVAMGVLTTLLTYTVPTGKTFYLNRIEVSGTNIGTYTVLFNSATNAKKYTFYGSLNELFDYTMGGNENGFPLVTGTTVTITTIHMITSPGDFNARLQGYEL